MDYARQTAHGLAAAHAKGIVHRDLKPENLFVTKDGRVKILDFGLAKLTEADAVGGQQTSLQTTPAGTEPGLIMGTMGYMSPEQVRAQPTDHRSDLFSFGAILYEMLSGKRAFKGETPADTMSAILNAEPPELTETNRTIPPGVERIVRHCLEKSPDERFQSAKDIAFDLDALSGLSGSTSAVAISRGTTGRRWMYRAAGIVASALAGAAIAGYFLRAEPTEPPEYRRITFRRGNVETARFAPDGTTVVYSAAWEGRPGELFVARAGSLGERALGIPEARVLSISSASEMALLVKVASGPNWIRRGTLARAPVDGGAPREVVQNVGSADWSPDGKTLAISRFLPDTGRWRLEYPIGKVLYETGQWLSDVRVSPAGDRIVYVEHPASGDDRGVVAQLDLAGQRKVLTAEFASVRGTAWSLPGNEILFTATQLGTGRKLFAIPPSGKLRTLDIVPASLQLEDVNREGRVLLASELQRGRIMVLPRGETTERDLAWLDYPLLRDISIDGKTILFDEEGEGGGPNYSVFIRGTDGAPAVRLGEGYGGELSPDGKWAVTYPLSDPPRIVLLPIGPGEPRTIESSSTANWFPDGKRLLLCSQLRSEKEPGCSIFDLERGRSSPLTPGGTETAGFLSRPVSPDGKWVVVRRPENQWLLWPVDGGEPRPLVGLDADDLPYQWAGDSNSLYVTSTRREDVLPRRVYKLNLATGRKEFFRTFGPPDLTGISTMSLPKFSRDGAVYTYGYRQFLSDLYVVDGIK